MRENHSAGSKNSPHSLVCVSGSVRRGRKNPLSHIPSSFLSIFPDFSLSFHQHFCLGPFFVMSSCNFLLFSIFPTSRSFILPAFHNYVQSLWPLVCNWLYIQHKGLLRMADHAIKISLFVSVAAISFIRAYLSLRVRNKSQFAWSHNSKLKIGMSVNKKIWLLLKTQINQLAI